MLVAFGLTTGALLVGGAETMLRLLDPGWLDRRATDDLAFLHTWSPVYGWEPRRNYRHVVAGRQTSTNAHGQRGRVHALERTPGRRRVVMLGDSLTFGYGVGDDETFSALLDRAPDLEVVNLGVQGYGTDQELLKLQHEGLAYRPELVIVNVCLANDLLDNAATRAIYDGTYPKPYFLLTNGQLFLQDAHLGLSWLQQMALLLSQRSFLYNRLTDLRRRPASPDAPPPGVEPAFELTAHLLRRIATTARGAGSEVVILVHPSLREFLRPSTRVARIRASPALADVPTVDLLPLLQARGVTEATYPEFALDGTFHLTVRGHALLAAIIREEILPPVRSRGGAVAR